jgi:molybdenum cofactor synthesis domain-containing protein
MTEENRNNIAAQPEVAAPSSSAASDEKEPQAPFVSDIVTAAVLVIGNEILSGRTKDRNIGHIAEILTEIGIDLKEVRVVADEEPALVAALNALRARYDYVFTTGGIGPTHDDITADSVAAAFGVPLDHHPRAVALLRERLGGGDLNPARMRMARIPRGGALIENRVSAAPGFWIGNVIVMAGVPAIMQAMLDEVRPKLRTGAKLIAETVRADLREGDIGSELAAVAAAYPHVMIGSYPFMDEVRGPNTNVVLRARDPEKLAAAKAAVERMIARVQTALAGQAGDGAPVARRPGDST